jgi:hypothetical protein
MCRWLPVMMRQRAGGAGSCQSSGVTVVAGSESRTRRLLGAAVQPRLAGKAALRACECW